MPTWAPPVTLVPNTNENVSDVQANFDSLRTVVNGLDDANIAATAGIQASKLATGATGLAQGAFSAVPSVATVVAASSVATKVTFGTEEYDVSGWFDTATSRFQPLVAGYYRLNASVVYATSLAAGTAIWLRLFKNGAHFKQLDERVLSATSANYQITGTASVLANGTTDFFEVFAVQTTAGTPSTSAAATDTYFQGEMIARS